jgi:hypothetical protein
MFKKIIFFLIFVLISPCCYSANKPSQLYKIEMLIFKRTQSHFAQKDENETPSNQGAPAWDEARKQPKNTLRQQYIRKRKRKPINSIDISPHISPDLESLNAINYSTLPAEQFGLTRIDKLLTKSYSVIARMTWIQSASKYREFIAPVPIYADQWYTKDGTLTSADTPSDTKNLIPEVSGNVTVSLNRYFNVKFNLTLNAPAKLYPDLLSKDDANAMKNKFFQFHLIQERRTRSNELNYIDHPMFGVIFKIVKA